MKFFSSKKYNSSKNDTILVTRFFGSVSILVNKCTQSGSYIVAMWKNAFEKIPKEYTPKEILLLGLAGGNTVDLLQKRYPYVKITILEWDEVMISIAKDLHLFSMNNNIKILQKDFFKELPKIQQIFDIIIVDLFTGNNPPIELTYTDTITGLMKILSPNGYLFLNIYTHVHYLPYFKNYFTEKSVWKYKYNTLGLFTRDNDSL